jgi:hypothetical protein
MSVGFRMPSIREALRPITPLFFVFTACCLAAHPIPSLAAPAKKPSAAKPAAGAKPRVNPPLAAAPVESLMPAEPPLQTAPGFVLSDLSGKPRSLKEFQDRPVALFFLCGSWSSWETIERWTQAHQPAASGRTGDASRTAGGPPAANTVVVFLGEPDDARDLAAGAGLDAARTVVLTDPSGQIARAYRAASCPRVFLIDTDGRVAFINTPPAAGARPATPADVVALSLGAERELIRSRLAETSDKKERKTAP